MNAWENHDDVEHNTASGTVIIAGHEAGQQLTTTDKQDACVQTDFVYVSSCVQTDSVYVYYENYKDKYETAMSERLQESSSVEDQRAKMNKTHAAELDLAVRRAEDTKMKCQQEIESYKEQNRKTIESLRTEIETLKKNLQAKTGMTVGGAENHPSVCATDSSSCKKPSKSKQILEQLSVEYPAYTREDFRAVCKEVRKQHGELSNKFLDFIIQRMREVINAKQMVVANNKMSTHPTSQQQHTATFTTIASNESPTSNNNVVGITVPAPMATDNDVRIKIKHLLHLWDNNGFLSEIEKHTSTVTGHTVQQLTTALTAYEETAYDYLQKLQGEESYKITLAKSYAIFAWIAKYISYDYIKQKNHF